VKRGEGNTNSPELSLLKILLLAYHHSHFLAATLDFTSFFTMAFLGPHIVLQLGCFGLDCTRQEAKVLVYVYKISATYLIILIFDA